MELGAHQHPNNPSECVTVLTRLPMLIPLLLPGLQHRQLPHQQRDVLQQVAVGQQELPHPGLRLDPCRCLGRQLVLQQLHLRDGMGWDNSERDDSERDASGPGGAGREEQPRERPVPAAPQRPLLAPPRHPSGPAEPVQPRAGMRRRPGAVRGVLLAPGNEKRVGEVPSREAPGCPL